LNAFKLDKELFKIVIVEDDQDTCDRITRIISKIEFLTLSARCGNIASGKKAIFDNQPDILLLDLELPDGNGIELIRLINEYNFSTKSIIITVFEDNKNIMNAISTGAAGYILKDDSSITIIDAIKIILAGGAPISPSIARHLLNSFQNNLDSISTKPNNLTEKLSPRESEILVLVSNGYTDKEIADLKNISYNTVTTHVKHIYKKLRVNKRVDVTHAAMRSGLISLEYLPQLFFGHTSQTIRFYQQ